MAYANYRYKGHNYLGEVHGEHLIPLAGLTDIGPETSADLLASAARLTESWVGLSEVTLRAASPRAGKILCVGLNYKDHADEASTAAFPVLFPKYPSTLIGPADDIILPPESTQVDFEGELAVIIGKRAKNVSEADALKYVLGYTIGNDVSERDWQKSDKTLWRAKNTDTFKPMGPWIETDVPDLDKLETIIRVNGEVTTRFKTNAMIYGVAKFISTISTCCALVPGDMIWMGTDDKSPNLKHGDVCEVEITGIGTLRNPFVREA